MAEESELSVEALIKRAQSEKKKLAEAVTAVSGPDEIAELVARGEIFDASLERLERLSTKETNSALSKDARNSTLELEAAILSAATGSASLQGKLEGEQLAFVNRLLFETPGGKRYTQDSPILPSVLIAYALEPREQVELILTLKGQESAGKAARRLRQMITAYRTKIKAGEVAQTVPMPLSEREAPRISYIPGQIAVRLYFDEMMRVVLPLTPWWHETYDALRHLQKKFRTDVKDKTFADWKGFPMPDPRREADVQEALMVMRREIDPTADKLFEDIAERRDPKLSEEKREERRKARKHKLKYAQQFPQDFSWFVRVIGLIADCFDTNTQLLADPKGLSAVLKRDFDARRNHDNSSLIETAKQREERIKRLTPALEEARENRGAIAHAFLNLFDGWADEDRYTRRKGEIDPDSNDRFPHERMIWRVTKNRPVHLASSGFSESAMTVKADAARRLFDVSCEKITWAILDSGIDRGHPAFYDTTEAHELEMLHKLRRKQQDDARADFKKAVRDLRNIHADEREEAKDALEADLKKRLNEIKNNRPELDPTKHLQSRVRLTLDFTQLRSLLEQDLGLEHKDRDAEDIAEHIEKRERAAKRTIQKRMSGNGKTKDAAKEAAIDLLADLRKRIDKGQDINWRDLEPAIVVEKPEAPTNDHGTHVAGILGADWIEDFDNEHTLPLDTRTRKLVGMCPEINLIDVRVFSEDGLTDEFELLAAIQFLRWMNERAGSMQVHGANLSLSLLHEVQLFACGQTPICDECNEASALGMVMVAAAGNRGFEQESARQLDRRDHYQSISVTDPGNADSVITVGATHRKRPHEYGVSYFSSRGPTGDGRMKPDLVAPGEKIQGPTPDQRWELKDGTSMAAPHVSGAAAMLMARHTELIGSPARIKAILCNTATDLGRERYFQGHGLVDALRALQSV